MLFKKEFYFTIHLTETEHNIVADLVESFCNQNELKFWYYRKFKTGHQPGYRECKVSGNISKFKKWLKTESVIVNNANKKELYNGRKIEKWLKDDLVRMN